MPHDAHAPAFDVIDEQQYEEAFSETLHQEQAGSWVLDRLPPGARVLDLGCGTGCPTARQMAEAGMHVVGVDESPRMLRAARVRVPGAQFLHRDMRALDDLGEFDAVVSFFALLMVPRSAVRAILREVRSRLRPPGLFALSMVEGDFDNFPIPFLGTTVRVTAYPPEDLAEEIRAAGFEVDEMREVDAKIEGDRVERQLFVLAAAR